MLTFPLTRSAPVVRTDFSDQESWEAVRAVIVAPSVGESFTASVEFVDDPLFGDLTSQQILALIATDVAAPQPCLFVVDATTLATPQWPVLVVDLREERGREFRTVASELHSIENNLSISNMDFFEFADAVEVDGVFRGF